MILQGKRSCCACRCIHRHQSLVGYLGCEMEMRISGETDKLFTTMKLLGINVTA